MPLNVSSSSFFPRMQFGPERIIRTPEDDIERRLKLAQLQNLESEPGLREREFQERQRQFNVTTGRDVALEQERAREFGITSGETARYHESEIADRRQALMQSLQESKEAHHAQVIDTLLKSLPYLSGSDKGTGLAGVAADVLKESGFPELSTAFAHLHEKQLDTQTKQNVGAITAAMRTGDKKTISNLMKGYEGIDPELRSRIRSSLPEQYRGYFPTQNSETPTSTATDLTTAPPPNLDSLMRSTGGTASPFSPRKRLAVTAAP